MDKIEDLIINIEDCVFRDDLSKFNGLLDSIIKEIIKLSKFIGENQIFKEITEMINVAIGNRDYLLLVDIFRYELMPFVDSNYVHGGDN